MPRLEGDMSIDVFKGNRIDNGQETVWESGLKGDVGVAFAEIIRSDPHYHKKMTEYYMVVRGEGTLYLDDKPVELKPSVVVKTEPGVVHYAVSKRPAKGIQLWVNSVPPWSIDDTYPMKPKRPRR